MDSFLPVMDVKVIKHDNTFIEIYHVISQKTFILKNLKFICLTIADGTKKIFPAKDIKKITYDKQWHDKSLFLAV
jgi:hypothetical protein